MQMGSSFETNRETSLAEVENDRHFTKRNDGSFSGGSPVGLPVRPCQSGFRTLLGLELRYPKLDISCKHFSLFCERRILREAPYAVTPTCAV